MACNYEAERREAILAGKRARGSLENALDALDSARGWGICDIIGGGFLSSLIKHSKMDRASEYLEEAKADLVRFGRELGDIGICPDVNLSTGDFWGFADCFFDGFLSDCVMQDRINEARRQLQQAIRRVDSILARL